MGKNRTPRTAVSSETLLGMRFLSFEDNVAVLPFPYKGATDFVFFSFYEKINENAPVAL